MSDIVKKAQDNYKRDRANWSDIYDKARADLIFQSDAADAQWDSNDYNLRITTTRPALTIDQLGQFVHQVANDIRMNTPTISVIPSGKEGAVKTAEIYKGLIRNIEYVSSADEAYDTASLYSVKCSIGFIRVDHDYVNDESFEQQLLIKRVINPMACFLDSNSTECDGSDAKHGTYIDTILVSDFKKKYPKAEVSSFGEDTRKFKDDEVINIAEYFEIDETTKEIGLLSTGEIEDRREGVDYSSIRTSRKKIVRRYILSGKEVLSETTFPGKYVPIVPVYGEEAWIEGKRELYSLIRKSKDAQRMYNYWKSLETELLMKQPNAPIMVVEGQIEDYAEDWKNPSKSMALRYKQVDADGNQAPAPQRLAPPTIPTGIVNAARSTVDDIKATMGLYNASIGARSNETSGIAIERRNQEGDVATFHFGDNLNRSITHVGRILVCAIPEIYDTPRIIRIIGEEDEPKSVGINGEIGEDQEETYNLKQGQYDVRVITGASFTTKRQEAVAFFSDIVSKQPDLMQVMGDLLFKNMDFAGAPAMAERMKKVIDPKFLEDDKDADPEKQQMATAIQQAEQVIAGLQQKMQEMAQDAQTEIDTLQAEIDNKEKETAIKGQSELNKAENEDKKMQIEILKLQLEKEKSDQEAAFKMGTLEIKRKELELKEYSMMIDTKQKADDMQHNIHMDMVDTMQDMNGPNELENYSNS